MKQVKVKVLQAVNALRDTTEGKVYAAEKYFPGEVVDACGFTDTVRKGDKCAYKFIDNVGDEVLILPRVDGKYLQEL